MFALLNAQIQHDHVPNICGSPVNDYPTKIKLTKQQKAAIPITRHEFHGDWNYTIKQSGG